MFLTWKEDHTFGQKQNDQVFQEAWTVACPLDRAAFFSGWGRGYCSNSVHTLESQCHSRPVTDDGGTTWVKQIL